MLVISCILKESPLTSFFNLIAPTGHMSLRDMGWMHLVCNSLCKMSNAASSVLVLRRDLLAEVMGASIQEQNNAIQSGIVALGSLWVSVSSVSATVAAGSLVLPVIACGIALSSAKWAWDSYIKNKQLISESDRFRAGMRSLSL